MTAPVGDARDDARLLRWLRREVNRDLRRYRQRLTWPPGDDADDIRDRIADCQAKRELLTWAESWQRVRGEDYKYPARPEVQVTLTSQLEMIMHAVRYVAGAYRNREGYRPEWDHAR